MTNSQEINHRKIFIYRVLLVIPVAISFAFILYSMQIAYDKLDAAKYLQKTIMFSLVVFSGGLAYDLLKIIFLSKNNIVINYICNGQKVFILFILGILCALINLSNIFSGVNDNLISYFSTAILNIIFFGYMVVNIEKFKKNDIS